MTHNSAIRVLLRVRSIWEAKEGMLWNQGTLYDLLTEAEIIPTYLLRKIEALIIEIFFIQGMGSFCERRPFAWLNGRRVALDSRRAIVLSFSRNKGEPQSALEADGSFAWPMKCGAWLRHASSFNVGKVAVIIEVSYGTSEVSLHFEIFVWTK